MKILTSKVTGAFAMLLLFAAAVTTASSQEKQKAIDVNALAAKGEAIGKVDPIVAAARTAEPDVLYRQGFDIATGIFGDPALGARGNTATGRGSLGIRDTLSAAGQRGFNASVKLHLSRKYKPTSGGPGGYDQSAPVSRVGENSAGAAAVILATRPPSNEVRCRGGRDRLIFTAENSKPDSTGETIIITLLTSEPGPYAAGPRGEGLRPGECAWVDRPGAVTAANERWFRFFLVRFETPANAQLKQKLHGSEVDTSPTAAERYPDARTIPAYMNDPNHYWSFFGVKRVNDFHVATGHAYFKPGIKDRDRVLIPKKPE